MSSAGQKEVLGAVEIIVGVIIDAVTEGSGGNWLIQMGVATMVSGGLQELANLLAPSPTPAAQNGIIRSTVASQQIVYGQVKTGGVVVFSDSYSTNNQYLVIAVAHSLTRNNGTSALGVQQMGDAFINDLQIPIADINASTGALTTGGAIDGNAFIWSYDGSQTTVDATLNGNFSYWASTAVGKGIAYTVFKLFNSSDQATFQGAFPQGIPNMLGRIISGQKVYDPRLDSTNGGSGSQRLATPSTWTYSNNPALCAADYLCRLKSDGGCGFATTLINWASVAAAANICDTSVTVPAYGATWNGSSWSSTVNVSQYSCNIALDTAQNVDQNLKAIIDCMAGAVIVAGNQIYLYAGAATASSGTIDDTFLAGSVSLTSVAARRSLWNAVKATYGQDPQCDYQQQEAVPVYNSTYETNDGGAAGATRLWKSINVPGCNNQFQAQYLEIIESHRSRNNVLLSLKCNLKMLQYKAWDVVSVTIAELNLSSAPFRIISFTLNSDLTIDVTLQQENSGTYTVALSQFGAFTAPNLTLAGTTAGAPIAPSGLSANPMTNGTILLKWTPPSPNFYQFQTIYRAPDVSGSPGTFSAIAKVVGGSWIDTNANGQKWWYQINATNYWLQTGPYSGQVSSTGQLSIIPAGKNACPNPSFQLNITNSPQNAGITALGSLVVDSWIVNDNNGVSGTGWQYLLETFSPRTGAQCLRINLPTSVSINNGVTANADVISPAITCKVGDVISFGGYIRPQNNASLPAGVTGTFFFSLDYFSQAGAFLGNATSANVGYSSSWTLSAASATVPSTIGGGTPAYVKIRCYAAIANASGSTFNTSTSSYAIVDYADLYVYFGDPTVAGNGVQLGDSRNVPGATASGVAQGFYLSGITLSSPSPTEIDCTSGTLLMGGSGTGNVAYNSSSVTGLVANTKYYLYYIDPGFAGGSQTLHATTTNTTLQNTSPYVVYLGFWTTPASGSGGSGGNGGCLHESTAVRARRSGEILTVPAMHLRAGDELLTEDGWQSILQIDAEMHDDWFHIGADRIEEPMPTLLTIVTPTQPFYRPDGAMVRANELNGGTLLKVDGGIAEVSHIGLQRRQPAKKIIIKLPPPHLFYLDAGGFFIHNGNPKP